MAGTISVRLASRLPKAAFQDFLGGIGAIPARDAVFDAILEEGDCMIRIVLTSEEREVLDPVDLENINRKLGTYPDEQRIVVEISNSPGSQILAVRFARAVVQKWPSVVDDLVDRIYSKEEVESLYQNGGDFSHAYDVDENQR